MNEMEMPISDHIMGCISSFTSQRPDQQSAKTCRPADWLTSAPVMSFNHKVFTQQFHRPVRQKNQPEKKNPCVCLHKGGRWTHTSQATSADKRFGRVVQWKPAQPRFTGCFSPFLSTQAGRLLTKALGFSEQFDHFHQQVVEDAERTDRSAETPSGRK